MIKHLIVSGDTLQSLAMRYTGSISNWVQIGQFNKLLSPELVVGSYVYIPDFDDSGNILANIDSMNFDTDLYLDDDYAINAYGDLLLVSGMDELIQDLQRRLNTRKGESLIHPDYGSNLEMIIAHYGIDSLKRIELEILETLYQDDRVKEAKVVSIVKLGKALQINCKITAKHEVASTEAILVYNT